MIFPNWLQVFGDQSYRDKNCPREAAESATFFNQLRLKYPDSIGRTATHIKNEGKKTALQAQLDKVQGQVKGAPDILIPGKPCFMLEMKRKDHTLSHWQTGQQEYLKQAQSQGAFVCVALGHEAALKAVEKWLAINNK